MEINIVVCVGGMNAPASHRSQIRTFSIFQEVGRPGQRLAEEEPGCGGEDLRDVDVDVEQQQAAGGQRTDGTVEEADRWRHHVLFQRNKVTKLFEEVQTPARPYNMTDDLHRFKLTPRALWHEAMRQASIRKIRLCWM